jgi:hypothetical protein
MEAHSELELKLLEGELSEKDHFSNILNNMRFRGWYKFEIDEGFSRHVICLFRMPPAIPLYDNVLRHFNEDERKAGLHRLLVGEDLRQEMAELLAQFNNDISECVANLGDDEVTDLLGKLQKIITFDCNKIPYLHIKLLKDDKSCRIDINEEVKKHVLNLPNYMSVFYDVLNEKINVEEASKLSEGIVYNEYLENIIKRGKNNHEGN